MNIRFLREEKKLTQKALAERLGVSRPSLAAYESGEAIPKLSVLVEMSEFFNVNIDDFIKKDLSREPGRPASPSSATQAEKTALQAEVIQLLKTRVRELEREILRKDPGLARELGIE